MDHNNAVEAKKNGALEALYCRAEVAVSHHIDAEQDPNPETCFWKER